MHGCVMADGRALALHCVFQSKRPGLRRFLRGRSPALLLLLRTASVPFCLLPRPPPCWPTGPPPPPTLLRTPPLPTHHHPLFPCPLLDPPPPLPRALSPLVCGAASAVGSMCARRQGRRRARGADASGAQRRDGGRQRRPGLHPAHHRAGRAVPPLLPYLLQKPIPLDPPWTPRCTATVRLATRCGAHALPGGGGRAGGHGRAKQARLRGVWLWRSGGWGGGWVGGGRKGRGGGERQRCQRGPCGGRLHVCSSP